MTAISYRIVKTLEDYREGLEPEIPDSLRYILKTATPWTNVRFAVGGPIRLKSQLRLTSPFLTVSGSTAPRPGITIEREQVTVFNTHHVTLRHLRLRCGDGFDSVEDRKAVHGQYDDYVDVPGRPNETGTGGVRSLVIMGETGPATDVLIENCSIQNSTDDNLAVYGDCRRIIVRRCLLNGGYANVHIRDQVVSGSRALIAAPPNPGTPVDDPHFLTIDQCIFHELSGRAPDVHGSIFHLTNSVIMGSRQGGNLTKARGNVVGNLLYTRPNHPWGVNADRQLVVDAGVEVRALYVYGNYLDGRPVGRDTLGEKNKGATSPNDIVFATQSYGGLPVIIDATTLATRLPKIVGTVYPEYDAADAGTLQRVAERLAAQPPTSPDRKFV